MVVPCSGITQVFRTLADIGVNIGSQRNGALGRGMDVRVRHEMYGKGGRLRAPKNFEQDEPAFEGDQMAKKMSGHEAERKIPA